MLDLERSWWLEWSTKQDAICSGLSRSPAYYYAALRRIVDLPEAVEYDPLVTLRVRRRIADQRRSRHAGAAQIGRRPR